MLFEYLSLFALVLITFVPDLKEFAEYFLVGSLITPALMFYLLMLQSILGLKSIGLNDDIELSYTWQTRTIITISAVVVYMSGFGWALFFALPFLLIGTISDITATLIILGFIEIETSDEEDEEEEKEDDDEPSPK